MPSIIETTALVQPSSIEPLKSGVAASTTSVPASASARFALISARSPAKSSPRVSTSAVVQTPMSFGLVRFFRLRIASSRWSAPPMMVATSSIAVVWSGIVSLKWRTKRTSAKEVQPWLPWNRGTQPSTPRKAKAAPSGWLDFSGLTEAAFSIGRT